MSEVNGPQKPVAMNYGGNSNRQREAAAVAAPERVKIEKVIEGRAVERKKGVGRRIKDHFQGENDMNSIASYVFWEVIVPKVKDLAVDAINEGTDRAFYGASRRSSSSNTRVVSRPTAYNRIYQSSNEPRTVSQRARTTHDFDQDIVLPSLGEAEKVLDTLIEYVEKYGFVSVMDLYDAVGVTNGEFTDEKHGWDDLRTAKPVRTRAGYILDLPPTKQRD
ncbi:hypothetical protein PP914_gp100 [Arthrobacter phage Qui]|jgi:hypothetical protein|uniref:Uncharacterized protein n=1 Tax=Arthrobacter phage Qui TaxID=2603260 RepID=A0A5B8WFL7_9CAUD|nr:hypothetical protein PP914_gp100 [Arthrobacter phage Qui]QED11590.1 hypothetical protein SEA_QUI_100 [Arthrobacter phage Qui]QOC56422.1 hypothetical protein SEA_PAELLA_100 [Arthrobacter phage Paella]